MPKPILIMVDIETDGPVPSFYSMYEIGAVVIESELTNTFHTKIKLVTKNSQDSALAAMKTTREALFNRVDAKSPSTAMSDFKTWLYYNARVQKGFHPVFISDNPGFDWQFVNYYFFKYLGTNPFGHSSRDLGSLYKGFVKDWSKNFKHLRKTKHDHSALNDALGNAEALLEMMNQGMGIPIPEKLEKPEGLLLDDSDVFFAPPVSTREFFRRANDDRPTRI